jgi:hypothetical protein
MIKRILVIFAAFMLCMGLVGCLETPVMEQGKGEGNKTEEASHPDMKVVTDGSFTAEVINKADDGITIEVTNSKNDNEVGATFTSAKINGKEYQINQATFAESPLSIERVGYEGKTSNLRLPANDYARLKISSSDFSSANDYNNVDLMYSETYMSDNGTVTKTGKTISVKNA